MSVYRVIDVIGTSPQSWEDAAATAVNTARKTLRDVEWPRWLSRICKSARMVRSRIAPGSGFRSSTRTNSRTGTLPLIGEGDRASPARANDRRPLATLGTASRDRTTHHLYLAGDRRAYRRAGRDRWLPCAVGLQATVTPVGMAERTLGTGHARRVRGTRGRSCSSR